MLPLEETGGRVHRSLHIISRDCMRTYNYLKNFSVKNHEVISLTWSDEAPSSKCLGPNYIFHYVQDSKLTELENVFDSTES